MAILTLTTDLGLRDHYVAALKGQLLSVLPALRIVDISHDVQPFDLAQAAYFLNNISGDFPSGTIHFIGVDTIPEIRLNGAVNRFPVAANIADQYFVGCDNGIFSLLKHQDNVKSIVRLEGFSTKQALRFPARHIYVPAMLRLLQGEHINDIGERTDSFNKVFEVQPAVGENLIKGRIIHTNKYGNVIVNVTEKLFGEVGKGNPFGIYLRTNSYFIDRISENYHEVPQGEKLALFNENGLLEIAINKGIEGSGGGAANLLGLRQGDMVRIEFEPRGSKDNLEDLFKGA